MSVVASACRVCLFLLSAIAAACSHVDEITPRSYVGLLIGDTAPLRREIAQALAEGKGSPRSGPFNHEPQGHGLTVAPVDFGWITMNGSIVLHNRKFGVVVIQEPVVSKDDVKWGCVVYPPEAKPNVCGSPQGLSSR